MPYTPYFRLLFRFCGIGLLLFAGLQFVRPELRNPPVSAEPAITAIPTKRNWRGLTELCLPTGSSRETYVGPGCT